MSFLRRWLEPDPANAPTTAPTAAAPPAAAPDVGTTAAAAVSDETATVRRIVARLEAMPPDQAKYLAGFAYILGRAAQADLDISDAETKVMERFGVELGGLDEAHAALVVEMAKAQAREQGATEDYVVTREFGQRSTREQKLRLLRCCFAVGAADETINADEAGVVNEIARELDVSRDDLNAVRAEFHENLSAIQAMRRMAAET